MYQKVLIVDDDQKLVSAIQTFLERNHITVVSADRGAKVEGILSAERPDLILLDVMLPDGSGLEVVRRLRASGNIIPILIISALTKTEDAVSGLKSGGDDYLRKPFAPQELLEKIRAMMRRVSQDAAAVESERVVVFGRNRFNLDSYQLSREGSEVVLSPADTALLKVFAEHPNRVLSRDQLVTLVHQYEQEVMDRSIDARVNRLRKKIELDPSRPQHLKTVRGFGYRFVLDSPSR